MGSRYTTDKEQMGNGDGQPIELDTTLAKKIKMADDYCLHVQTLGGNLAPNGSSVHQASPSNKASVSFPCLSLPGKLQ
jgi:hypothetical protein